MFEIKRFKSIDDMLDYIKSVVNDDVEVEHRNYNVISISNRFYSLSFHYYIVGDEFHLNRRAISMIKSMSNKRDIHFLV